MVERQLPKLNVAGSSPVFRSTRLSLDAIRVWAFFVSVTKYSRLKFASNT